LYFSHLVASPQPASAQPDALKPLITLPAGQNKSTLEEAAPQILQLVQAQLLKFPAPLKHLPPPASVQMSPLA